MDVNNEINDVFSILHDGIIKGWEGDKEFLRLTVSCKYLAQSLDKSFDRFYVDLIQIEELRLSTWPNPFDLPVNSLTDISLIFKFDLEILSSKIIDNKVIVSCNQHDVSSGYSGGNLTILCNNIKVFDQNKNELSIEFLDSISNIYWNSLI